jgi:phosphate transport system ATP-binding protein
VDPGRQIELQTEDVSVSFGKRKVLEGVSIAFPKNAVTALIGPSGCGKSAFNFAPPSG